MAAMQFGLMRMREESGAIAMGLMHPAHQALRDFDGRVAAGPDQAASHHWRAVQSPKP